jgi:hypothetical protein
MSRYNSKPKNNNHQFDEPIQLTVTKEQLGLLIKLFSGRVHHEPEEYWLMGYLNCKWNENDK